MRSQGLEKVDLYKDEEALMQMQKDEKGDFCFLANLRSYLKTFDIQQEEYWIGGVTGVMGFYFTTLKENIPSVIHGRSEEFERLYEAFTQYFKVPLTKEQFSSKQLMLLRIRELLKLGMTPMVWMDEFYIPQAYNYQKNHLWVMAVIEKELEQELEIFNNEPLIVAKDDLEKLCLRNGNMEMQYLEEGKLQWRYLDQEMVIKGLGRVIQNAKKQSTLPQQYFGIDGMKRYKEVFADCKDEKEIYNYFYEMNRGGGLYKTRRSMALFLKEVEESVKIYNQLEEKWTKITNLTFKLSVCKDKALHKRISKRLEEVIGLEEQGINALDKLTYRLGKDL